MVRVARDNHPRARFEISPEGYGGHPMKVLVNLRRPAEWESRLRRHGLHLEAHAIHEIDDPRHGTRSTPAKHSADARRFLGPCPPSAQRGTCVGRLHAPYPWWMQVLVVDGANVVGSRPDGWWRDRAGAARRLHDRLSATELPQDEVVLVLEGEARRGRRAGQEGRVRTVHAARSGDDAVVDEVMRQVAIGDGRGVIVVTADRMLRDRVETAGASSQSPGWLLDQL